MGDHLDVASNPSYVGGAPKIANVRIQMYAATSTMGLALRQHEIDYAETFDPANFDRLRRDPGLDAAVEPFSTFSAGHYDLASVANGGGDDIENDFLYTCANRSLAGNNIEGLCDPHMDALQVEANAEYDPVRRRALVSQIENLAVSDAAFESLWYDAWLLVGSPSLHRMHSGHDNPWYGIARWTFDGTAAR